MPLGRFTGPGRLSGLEPTGSEFIHIGATLNSSVYNATGHRFLVVMACLAFLLVIAGGLVTSKCKREVATA